ncbi:hypothetical protein Hypma_005523 [Hypsizygus marmoreus]|uniref:Uncharacterized protein n=1 Tax=Hypsizygus marmoreus TaxID=39966 RepID=A0A369JWB5_HYPMA|nr:hypothetical protein Hypma_005523 [Hypsizygus marmoreus]
MLGTDSKLVVRTMRPLSKGALIQIKDFSTVAPGIDPITGISSVSAVLTLNNRTITLARTAQRQSQLRT